jgi:hypothetical protein
MIQRGSPAGAKFSRPSLLPFPGLNSHSNSHPLASNGCRSDGVNEREHPFVPYSEPQAPPNHNLALRTPLHSGHGPPSRLRRGPCRVIGDGPSRRACLHVSRRARPTRNLRLSSLRGGTDHPDHQAHRPPCTPPAGQPVPVQPPGSSGARHAGRFAHSVGHESRPYKTPPRVLQGVAPLNLVTWAHLPSP